MVQQGQSDIGGYVMVIILWLFVIPLSLLFWTFNVILTSTKGPEVISHPLSPWRWLFAVLVPILVVRNGVKKKSLNTSGAVASLVVGLIMTLSNYCFFSSMLAFFITASKATKFRSNQKHKLEDDFKEGGQRNWVQVICNGGVATLLAAIYMMESGCGEYLINFSRSYNISWLCMGVLGALACSAGDTFASEFGSVLGSSEPYLITSLRKVPRGTNGGVSFWGLVASLLGGLVVGVAYYITLLFCCTPDQLHRAPPQWPIVFVGALAGFFGSLLDSLFGASLQYSGYDPDKQRIVEVPGPRVQYISGSTLLDNHSVNLLSGFFTAMATPHLALHFWEAFS